MSEGKEYVYYTSQEEHKTKHNSVIIIGANGSGKSRFGEWMERKMSGSHRICGQRSLLYKEDPTIKSTSDAEFVLLHGYEHNLDGGPSGNLRSEYDERGYVVSELQDFGHALTALLARYNDEINEYYHRARANASVKKSIENPPDTILDKLTCIWSKIFPRKKLKYKNHSFWVEANGIEYNVRQMSDGERSVLYLCSQILSIHEGKINNIIIDEPEIHLHPSIMNKLWKEIEETRRDLLFIYVTQDISFASTHGNSDKIWVNEYLGDEKWSYQVLSNNDELPEELLLEILGCRQNILFIEGERSSLDYRLYSALFPNLYIMSCGGCEQVIQRTKAVNRLKSEYSLYNYDAFGLIDRDYRNEDDINRNESDGVFCLKVAEAENLFIAEKVLHRIVDSMGKGGEWSNIFLNTKNLVIEERYINAIKEQELNNIKYEINKSVKNVSIIGKKEEDIQQAIEHIVDKIGYSQIKIDIKNKYETYINKTYDQILAIYNDKGLVNDVGSLLGMRNKKNYCRVVIDMLSSDEELRNCFYDYIPKRMIEAVTAKE